MKKKVVMRLFALMLATAMVATSVPMMPVPVYAEDLGEAESVLVTADNVKNYLNYNLSSLELVYEGGNQAWRVEEKISTKEGYYYEGIALTFKEVKASGTAGESSSELVDAGTYQVYATLTGGNLYSDGAILLGTVSVAKAPDDSAWGDWVVPSESSVTYRYAIDDAVSRWAEENENADIDAEVTCDSSYVVACDYDKEGKRITFQLAADMDGVEEETSIHVTFGDDCFNNYDVEFDIPVVITSKDIVGISWSTENGDLIYNGENQELIYSVTQWDEEGKPTETTGSSITGLTVSITKDGQSVTEIKDAGRYIVKAEYKSEEGDKTYYGKSTFDIWVSQ